MLNSIHVVHNANGGWDIKRGGQENPLGHRELKADAIDEARAISKKEKGELFIHGEDGKIQQRDSHGNDPRSSKG